jgi:hypothetical protein
MERDTIKFATTNRNPIRKKKGELEEKVLFLKGISMPEKECVIL